jgi:signal-transduction protein with cAMP-binding, CBS, and nucleotidyltransferase domain
MGLLARDVMEAPVLSVEAGVDALGCARSMVQQRKGYAVVMEDGHVGGIVTEWDFVEKVIAAGKDPSRVRVGEIATPRVQSCAPESPVDEVVSAMAKGGIRRMLVISGDQVLGIITARTVLAQFRRYVDQLSSEIAAHHSDPVTLG